MDSKTMLCLDSESLKRPELIGLHDEDIAAQEWLDTFCTADDARQALNSAGDSEVWVVSCDDMEGINLAAALKRDHSERNIELVSFGGTGSEFGRCQAAGVGLIRGEAEFVKRYAERKTSKAFAASRKKGDVAFSGHKMQMSSLRIDEPTLSDFTEASSHSPRSGLSEQRVVQSDARREYPEPVKKDASKSGFVLSVISGNGGVGKSTVSACLAILLQQRGLKTVLVDFDLQFGDAAFLLGAERALGLDEFIRHPERIARMDSPNGLPAVIGTPEKLEQSEAAVNHVGEMLDLLKVQFDAVVVNTGSFWSDCHIQVIESSEQVLFILDQRPSSVRSCSRALDLCSRCGIAIQPFRFLLNLCSKHALLSALDVSCALQGIQVEELKDGGREVGELLGAGLPLELASSKNPFILSLKELLPSLIPARFRLGESQEVSMPAEKKTLFSGIRKRRTA